MLHSRATLVCAVHAHEHALLQAQAFPSSVVHRHGRLAMTSRRAMVHTPAIGSRARPVLGKRVFIALTQGHSQMDNPTAQQEEDQRDS